MQLSIWKQIYLTPLVRLNLYTREFSISLGHRRIDWNTSGKRGIWETLRASVFGVYLSEAAMCRLLASCDLIYPGKVALKNFESYTTYS